MNQLTTDQTIRISKAILMLFISFFGLMLIYSNFADYATNYEYVAHILSMDTTRTGTKYGYRAITSPMAHHRIYWLIITLDVLFTALCIVGTYQLFKNLSNSSEEFHEAKKFSLVGLLIAIFIYYICFQVIGVEWFNMDESPHWNYKSWARDIVNFILPLMIYIAIRIER